MKEILVSLFLFTSISWSQVYMNIINKDGTKESFDMETIEKLTFGGPITAKDSKIMRSTMKSFTLLQNYPNPFNPSTTIEYQIPKAGYTEVKIYDILGRLVKVIKSGYHNPGSYKVSWNSKNDRGQSVASGIYLLQVIYNNSALTKKIMLIK